MGIDISGLSPAAQRQAYAKLCKANQERAHAALYHQAGKQPSEEKASHRGSKYGNKKVEVSGILFDSKKEAQRWIELDAMQTVGQISNLRRQVKYELIPNQRVNGKVVERAVNYVADFVYEQNGETIVEDTKGMKTRDYILKRKMMLWFHGIQIKEV